MITRRSLTMSLVSVGTYLMGPGGCSKLQWYRHAQSEPASSISIAGGTRDVFLQPFASDSIWNMPISDGAVYAPCNITITTSTSINTDDDVIIFHPTAPMRDVRANRVGWSSSDRCGSAGTSIGEQVPVPDNFVLGNQNTPLASAEGGSTPNNAGGFLSPDGRTIKQYQPIHRCTAGGPVTIYTGGHWFPDADLYGDGRLGAHGGSQLSGIGGAIRLGELVPGSSPIVTGVADVIRHALKFEFQGRKFDTFMSNNGITYEVWPATTHDDGNEGLLLALLPSFNYNGLRTPPGRSIAWTLINYGAYVVDSAGGGDNFTICLAVTCDANGTIESVWQEFESEWGHPFLCATWRQDTWTDWRDDLIDIVANLHCITNNGPSSIGGGGAPRQPLAPPVSPPRDG